MATLGIICTFGGIIAVLLLVTLRGRLPELEEHLASWLLRDAAGWRARTKRKAELRQSVARLEVVG